MPIEDFLKISFSSSREKVSKQEIITFLALSEIVKMKNVSKSGNEKLEKIAYLAFDNSRLGIRQQCKNNWIKILFMSRGRFHLWPYLCHIFLALRSVNEAAVWRRMTRVKWNSAMSIKHVRHHTHRIAHQAAKEQT